MARFGSNLRVDKKGAIDLVTEVDVEVERMFRALIGERFPDHDVLARGNGRRARPARRIGGCSIRWTAPPTTRTVSRSFARRWRSRSMVHPAVGAVFDPNRRELFTAERGVGAWLNGEPIKVSRRQLLDRFGARHRVSRTTSATRMDEILGLVRSVPSRGARGPPAGFSGDRPVLGGGRSDGRVLGAGPPGMGHDGGRADCPGGRRARDRTRTAGPGTRTAAVYWRRTAASTKRC